MVDESIVKRLERLTERFSEKQFLENRGLGNEIGIHVFAYDPKDEMVIRRYIKKLHEQSYKYNFKIHENDLFEMFLDICRENDVLDDLPDFEDEHGFDELQKQIENFASVDEYLPRLQPPVREQGKDIVVITGLGKVFPFMRSHTILENIQPIINDVPIVLFYPGEYDNHTLNLFGQFRDGNYYRAFKII